jgi:hydroxyacylglutathione hydrolase
VLNITSIPAFQDNYIWLLGRPGSDRVAVVDPGDAAPVLRLLTQRELELGAILITHHHRDHTGGIAALTRAWPGCRVYGSGERIAGVTDPVEEGETITPPGLDAEFKVLEVPGHTADHVAYLGEGALFCGDTLFAAGCGRVFDGSFEQLADSLRRIAALPSDTLVYCAHEYTLDNLGFADWVEPDSPALLQRRQMDERRRGDGEPTVPSTLALELATNPFLRTGDPGVIAAARRHAGRDLNGHAQVFQVLREWKDREYD